MVAAIKKFPQSSSILEVGSAGLGIVPYLKRSVVGVDLTFPQPIHEDLIPVKADALELPFSDNAFDIVISTDMLEHIKAEDRRKAIGEMMRVARKLVCIGVPTGKLAHQQDEQLRRLYSKKHNTAYNFLEEQVEYGVPMRNEIEEYIIQSAKHFNKKMNLTSQGNINLSLRKFLMYGWISDNLLINIFFRKVLLLAIPLMKSMNQEPTYRTIFTATID